MPSARTSYAAWRNPHLAGFVALLFTALTLFAAAPHGHAGTNVREAAGGGRVLGENRASALATPLSPAVSSSCALCDWLILPGLPTAASSAPLVQTVAAFTPWVTMPLASTRTRTVFRQRPRGPPALTLS